MEKEVTVINHRVDTPKEMITIKEKEKEIKRLATTLRKLKSLDALTKEKDIVNDFLLYTICNHVPKTLFFKSFHINAENVQIEGISKTKIAIAQFKHSLEEIIYFQDIYIPSISEGEDGYTFTLLFHIGDDKEDGSN
jgi:Tfp pilus assembly protein PilN